MIEIGDRWKKGRDEYNEVTVHKIEMKGSFAILHTGKGRILVHKADLFEFELGTKVMISEAMFTTKTGLLYGCKIREE